MPVPACRRCKLGTALFIILVTLAPGCAHRSLDRHSHSVGSGLPSRVEILSVPFFPQHGHCCGPAAMAMVLQWTGETVSPHNLAAEMFTPLQKGSLQPALITASRRHNRLAYPIKGPEALLTELAAGHPVIVLQNLGLRWLPQWHYAVSIGYDLQKKAIILHSGLESGRYMDWRLFSRTWKRGDDWGLVVLPIGRLPASADEQSYLKSVLGLEQAGQWAGAARAYKAAVEHWPSSLSALIGLGNCCYAAGNLAAAEQAFRQAVQVHPESGAAFNNLAHVLAESGRYAEAMEMATRALARGGTQTSLYRRTRQEIQRLRDAERE